MNKPQTRRPRGAAGAALPTDLPPGLNTGHGVPVPNAAEQAADTQPEQLELDSEDQPEQPELESEDTITALPYLLQVPILEGVCKLEEQARGLLTVYVEQETVVEAIVIAQRVACNGPDAPPFRWVAETTGREEHVWPSLAGAPVVLPPGRHILQANPQTWTAYTDPEMKRLTSQAYSVVLEQRRITLGPTEAPMCGVVNVPEAGAYPLPAGCRSALWSPDGGPPGSFNQRGEAVELSSGIGSLRAGGRAQVGPALSFTAAGAGVLYCWR